MSKQPVIMGSAEEGAVAQALNCMEDAEHFCLMADNHKGYGMPVGGVAVYKDKISPAGVGFDIACGNKAVLTTLDYEDVCDRLPQLADKIWENLSFGVGLTNATRIDHALFDSPAWDLDVYKKDQSIKATARNQLGTIGAGNHYVDIFVDEQERVWIGVHFGSRGLGHKTATHFMKLAGDNPANIDEKPHLLDVNTDAGREYIAAMQLAGEYAYAGRDWVCQRVAELMGAQIVLEVHNHHNFAWKETHDGQDYWVVRKGATPAFPDQWGFIGGSMGDDAVIVRGVDSEKSASLFYSTVHGAGRVMSRTKAAGKFKGWGSNRVKVADGLVDFNKVKSGLVASGILLRGGGADEAPEVYKRLPEVLDAHAGTIRIEQTLRPLIVCMASDETHDPYKD